ncbi:hypothetical protein [Brumimicrobium aurantiacum]|uniref:Uncharacterized protein n=1 Tax=Brumimicrobium aurantiacum TaxID=1737063 RepID=A0A3E1EVR4_9FLAO|nr:hypothetical protein [Brumimicrobium aurantiacum]RFC53637.1 hypothetical protein DXU93_12820 [Brumimicrobium aurantiacum]
MLKFVFQFIFIFGVVFGYRGQVIAEFEDFTMYYGDQTRSNASVEDFIISKSNQLHCIQNQLTFTNLFSKNTSKYSFDFVSNYTLPESKSITFHGQGNKSSLFLYTPLGDQLLGISSQETVFNKEPKLFYHIINPKVQGRNNYGFELNPNIIVNKNNDLSQITLVSSDDKENAAVIYVPKTRPNEFTQVGYLNFNFKNPVPKGGTFVYPFPTSEYKLLDFYIQDSNLQFILSGHYSIDHTSQFTGKQKDNFESITIGKIENNSFEFETIQFEGKFFNQIGIYKDNEAMILSGFYTNFIDGDVEGLFIAKINTEGKVTDHHFAPFSKDITIGISGTNNRLTPDHNTIRNAYKGFSILEFIAINDGYIGIAEFNALEYKYGSNDVPGAANAVDSYFWSNDIVTFKITKSGDFAWNKIIQKHQRSINDGGYYLSNSSIIHEDHLHLFFNDSKLNYNENGVYIRKGKLPFSTHFSTAKNTIAHTKIDINTGEVSRKSTIGKEQSNVIFTPLLSRGASKENKMFIYGRSGKKHRLGSIHFKQ